MGLPIGLQTFSTATGTYFQADVDLSGLRFQNGVSIPAHVSDKQRPWKYPRFELIGRLLIKEGFTENDVGFLA
jgi:hypothetical protein